MHELPIHRKDANVVGYAGMTKDGTILMRVRNAEQRALAFYAPGDEKYAQVFAQLGGISPGQMEPITFVKKH